METFDVKQHEYVVSPQQWLEKQLEFQIAVAHESYIQLHLTRFYQQFECVLRGRTAKASQQYKSSKKQAEEDDEKKKPESDNKKQGGDCALLKEEVEQEEQANKKIEMDAFSMNFRLFNAQDADLATFAERLETYCECCFLVIPDHDVLQKWKKILRHGENENEENKERDKGKENNEKDLCVSITRMIDFLIMYITHYADASYLFRILQKDQEWALVCFLVSFMKARTIYVKNLAFWQWCDTVLCTDLHEENAIARLLQTSLQKIETASQEERRQKERKEAEERKRAADLALYLRRQMILWQMVESTLEEQDLTKYRAVLQVFEVNLTIFQWAASKKEREKETKAKEAKEQEERERKEQSEKKAEEEKEKEKEKEKDIENETKQTQIVELENQKLIEEVQTCKISLFSKADAFLKTCDDSIARNNASGENDFKAAYHIVKEALDTFAKTRQKYPEAMKELDYLYSKQTQIIFDFQKTSSFALLFPSSSSS